MAKTVGNVGEFGLVREILRRLPHDRRVLVGAGDDCAVAVGPRRLVLTTDALVEGVHFERDWQSPAALGAKAVAVNASDIASMGGSSRYFLMSIGLPRDYPLRSATEIHRGAARAATAVGGVLVGGNVSSSPKLFLSVAAVGAVGPRPLRRSGARPGDIVFVTGTLGDAAAGLRLLQSGLTGGTSRRKLIRRFVAPQVRTAAGARLGAAGIVSSMIDVSDGLIQDLAHVCESSGVGALVGESEVPLSQVYRDVVGDDPSLALDGGEDYELLFTVPARKLRAFERLRKGLGCPVSRIGQIVRRPHGVRVQDAEGRARRPRRGGYDHFRPVQR